MRHRRRPTKSTRASSNETPDDYSIYLNIDRIKPTDLPFRIADYREEGIFTDDEQKVLSERHGLAAKHTKELSLLVGNALDCNSDVSFVRISRSRVQRRLERALKGERMRTKPLLDDIDAINRTFASLSLPYFVPTSHDRLGEHQIAEAPEGFSGDRPTGSRIPVSLKVARAVLVPDDYRTEADERRRAVVVQCCYVALDAGWPLSFTSDPSLNNTLRTGRLVDLIRDVVRLTTDPSNTISGDTIVSDIEIARLRMIDNGDYPA
ncbi:hypothetical protein KUV65_00020 [Maritalea mobilis]|uniref:hypothetical protein n=1 Tax=Maritalea mobilis TaxID=483324 RepID=UPI001C941A58|nr:hypothetical protein [Maritalea mobilis]MBY6199735.1 hypothetical protein [Maritalea mobilis]